MRHEKKTCRIFIFLLKRKLAPNKKPTTRNATHRKPHQNKTKQQNQKKKTKQLTHQTTRRQHPKRIENLVIRFRLGTFGLPSSFLGLALFLFRFVFGMNLFSREKFFISNNESRSDRRFLNAHPPYTTYTPV